MVINSKGAMHLALWGTDEHRGQDLDRRDLVLGPGTFSGPSGTFHPGPAVLGAVLGARTRELARAPERRPEREQTSDRAIFGRLDDWMHHQRGLGGRVVPRPGDFRVWLQPQRSGTGRCMHLTNHKVEGGGVMELQPYLIGGRQMQRDEDAAGRGIFGHPNLWKGGREAINGNQWQSKAIKGNQRIFGHPKLWKGGREAINGNQWQSSLKRSCGRGGERQSMAIKGNQLIFGHTNLDHLI